MSVGGSSPMPAIVPARPASLAFGPAFSCTPFVPGGGAGEAVHVCSIALWAAGGSGCGRIRRYRRRGGELRQRVDEGLSCSRSRRGRHGGSRRSRHGGGDARSPTRGHSHLAARRQRLRAAVALRVRRPSLVVPVDHGHAAALQDEQTLEVELRDRRERRQILERRVVDDVGQRPLAVEEPQDPVELVGDLVQPLEQLPVVDLEDASSAAGAARRGAPTRRPAASPP